MTTAKMGDPELDLPHDTYIATFLDRDRAEATVKLINQSCMLGRIEHYLRVVADFDDFEDQAQQLFFIIYVRTRNLLVPNMESRLQDFSDGARAALSAISIPGNLPASCRLPSGWATYSDEEESAS